MQSTLVKQETLPRSCKKHLNQNKYTTCDITTCDSCQGNVWNWGTRIKQLSVCTLYSFQTIECLQNLSCIIQGDQNSLWPHYSTKLPLSIVFHKNKEVCMLSCTITIYEGKCKVWCNQWRIVSFRGPRLFVFIGPRHIIHVEIILHSFT